MQNIHLCPTAVWNHDLCSPVTKAPMKDRKRAREKREQCVQKVVTAL